MLSVLSKRIIKVNNNIRSFAFSTGNRLSLDKFFSKSDSDYTLSDEKAMAYMQMAADLSLISRFKDPAEMLQYKNDFQAALMFIKKLEEIKVPEGTEPLANVLEYYGGNDQKMRSKEEDYVDSDKYEIKDEIKKINRHM